MNNNDLKSSVKHSKGKRAVIKKRSSKRNMNKKRGGASGEQNIPAATPVGEQREGINEVLATLRQMQTGSANMHTNLKRLIKRADHHSQEAAEAAGSILKTVEEQNITSPDELASFLAKPVVPAFTGRSRYAGTSGIGWKNPKDIPARPPVHEETLEELQERLHIMKEQQAAQKQREELLANQERIRSNIPEALFHLSTVNKPSDKFFGNLGAQQRKIGNRHLTTLSPEDIQRSEHEQERIKIEEVLHFAFSQIQKNSEEIAELKETISKLTHF